MYLIIGKPTIKLDPLYNVAYVELIRPKDARPFIILMQLAHQYNAKNKRIWRKAFHMAELYSQPTFDMTVNGYNFNVILSIWKDDPDYGNMVGRFHYNSSTGIMTWKGTSVLYHMTQLILKKFKFRHEVFAPHWPPGGTDVDLIVKGFCDGVIYYLVKLYIQVSNNFGFRMFNRTVIIMAMDIMSWKALAIQILLMDTIHF